MKKGQKLMQEAHVQYGIFINNYSIEPNIVFMNNLDFNSILKAHKEIFESPIIEDANYNILGCKIKKSKDVKKGKFYFLYSLYPHED